MRKTTAIKAILFDLGKVIVKFDFDPAFKKASKHCDKSPDEIRDFFGKSGLEVLYDGGKITSKQFYETVREELNLRVEYEGFKRIWNHIFTPNKPVIKLIQKLKKNGYRLVLVSNTNAMHWEYIQKKYPVLSLFDKHILSFKEKIRKPDEKIYNLSARACKAKPQEIFYIDDRHDMTEVAGELRFNVFTYKLNTDELIKDMRSKGIKC